MAGADPCFTVAGNRLELLTGGARRLDALLALIAGATASLRILYYIYEDDEAGVAVRDALVAAARRGVAVSVIVDAMGSEGIGDGDFFRSLEQAGGTVCSFLPRLGRRYLLRNHQKLALADDARIIIGGFNVENAYFGEAADGAWRDLGLLVEGPAAGRLSGYFDALAGWTDDPKAKLRTLARLLRRWSERDGQVRWLLGGPSRRLSPWARTIKREMQRARRMDMIVAYFAPGPLILRRLGALARRGRLRLVLPARSDNRMTVRASRFTYRNLLRHRAEIFEYQPARLHTKLFVIDDVVHIGSANFDVRSMFLNMELMLRIDDPAFAAHVRGYVDGEVAQSEAITPALDDARSGPWRRLGQGIAYFLLSAVDFNVSHGLNFRRGRID